MLHLTCKEKRAPGGGQTDYEGLRNTCAARPGHTTLWEAALGGHALPKRTIAELGLASHHPGACARILFAVGATTRSVPVSTPR